MAQRGILSGYSDGSFRPNASITTAEFTSVIGRIMGLSGSNDTVTNHWAAPILKSAMDKVGMITTKIHRLERCMTSYKKATCC